MHEYPAGAPQRALFCCLEIATLTRKPPAKSTAKTDSNPAIPASITSDAVAVMFTFSFGTSFAATGATDDDVKATVSALKDASVAIQSAIDSEAAAYKSTLQTDDDGYVVAAKGNISTVSGKISKAIMEARIDKVAEDAKNAFDAEVKKVQNAVEKEGTTASVFSSKLDIKNVTTAKTYVDKMYKGEAEYGCDGVGAELSGANKVQFKGTTTNFDAIFADATLVLADKDYGSTGTAAVVVDQYKADKDAVTDLLNAFRADADKYSDNIKDKEYTAATNLVGEGDSSVTVYTADLAAGTSQLQTGTTKKYLVSELTGKSTAQSAREFVKNFVDYQLKVVDAIDAAKDVSSNNVKESVTGIDALRNVKSLANDVLKGHKITAAENYYVEAVPTKEESTGEGLTIDKNRAIRELKAELNAGIVKIEKTLDDALKAENRKSKPDTKKVKELKEALDDLNGQALAAEEYITAVINYANSSAEVDKVKEDLKTGSNVINMKNVLTFTTTGNTDTDYANFKSTTPVSGSASAQVVLKAVKKISENVVELKKEAELLKAQLEVNGADYFDAAVLADNLEDQIEKLYKTKETDLTTLKTLLNTAKENLWNGSEYTLVLNKYRYTEYIKGNETTDGSNTWVPKDKNGNDLNDTNVANKKAWNKSDAKRTALGADVKVAVLGGYTAYKQNATPKVYDKAQAAALKALVEETEKAIKEAKTLAEVKAIFVAAQAKYEDIPTTVDHLNDWEKSKPIGKEYDKQKYDDQLNQYINYVGARVDFYENCYFTGKASMDAEKAILNNARKIMFKAYNKDELAAKFDEAKAMIDNVPTKAVVKDAKKAVEDAINALPTTVTLADKDAIVKAADALDGYKNLLGNTKPSINNETKLVSAKTAYEKLAATELDDAYRALKNKTIAVEDEAAITALRGLHDAYWDYIDDYCTDDNIKSTALDSTELAYDAKVSDLENDLSDAKVRHARELMVKIPANPAYAKRADVEAARAYYDSLKLKEQLQVVGTPAYKAFLDAEEALGINAKASVKELKITTKSTAKKGSITVKWTVKGDASAVDGYEVWKSTKQSKGFKKAITTKKTTYKNTKGLKKGTRYYYKVRAYKVVDGTKITSDWSNKAYRKAK